jgi:hypothetical protein
MNPISKIAFGNENIDADVDAITEDMEDDGSLGRQLKMQQDQKTVFRKLLMTS